jgi:hypothetical protein
LSVAQDAAPEPAAPQAAAPAPADDQVVWSRKVERLAPEIAVAQDGPAGMPDVWARAIERGGGPAATTTPDGSTAGDAAERDSDQPGEAPDRPVLQPSASTLSRYRAPLLEAAPEAPDVAPEVAPEAAPASGSDTEPTAPDVAPQSDLDLGGGI